MAILVQKSAGNLSTLISGNEFYENCYANNTFPNNGGGTNVGTISISTTDRNIHFTPTTAGNFKGVIFSLYNSYFGGVTARYRDIRVRLQENTGSWVTQLEETFSTNNWIANNTWAMHRGLIDCRFTSSYPITTASSTWRLVVDYVSGGSGSFYLNFAQDGANCDNLFMIPYIDSTVTLTSSDTLVVTDQITLDQNLTLAREDADHGTNDDMDYRSRYYSIWSCSPIVKSGSETNPQIYVPSTVAGDYKIDLAGGWHLSSRQPKALLVGEDAANPIPYDWSDRAAASNRTFELEFSNQVSGQSEYGFISGSAVGYKFGKLAGIEMWGTKPTQMWATLKSDALASQATAVLDGDLTDSWAVGDNIMCGGSRYSSTRSYRSWAYNEIREIQSISYSAGSDETTIVFTTNLGRNHYYDADITPRFTLKERNIIVGGNDTTYNAESYWSIQNGTVKMQGVLLHDIQQIYYRYSYAKYMSAQEQIDAKCLFDGCNLHDCYRPIYFQNWQTAVEVCNCTASSDLTGTTLRCDRFYYSTYSKGHHIHDNVVVGRFIYGVTLVGSSDCIAEDNHFNVRYGIALSSGSAKNNMLNNSFGICRVGIYMEGCSNNYFEGNIYRYCYYDSNYSATSESTHGCYSFNPQYNNSGNVSVNEDADDSFAFVVQQNDGGSTHIFQNCKFGVNFTDGVVSESGANYRTGWNAGTELRFQNWDEGATDYRDFFTNTNMISDTSELYGNDELSLRFQPYPSIGSDGEVDFVKKIFIEQEVTIRGHIKKNAAYTGETPGLEIIGDTTDSFTMADNEDWQSFSIDAETDSKGEVTFRVTTPQTIIDACYLWLGTVYLDCMGTSYLLFGHDDYWFDGLPEYKIDPIESDNYIVATEAVALAYTGINVDTTAQEITISENHTLQEVYDYIRYDTASDASLLYPGVISTADGSTYILMDDWDLIINTGITVTAVGKKLVLGGTGTWNLIGTADFTGILTDGINTRARFQFTLLPSITGYEWRIYTIDNIGSMEGAVEVDGEETSISDNQSYIFTHTSDYIIAVQIIGHIANDYVENTTYYTIEAENQNLNINIIKDINN